MSLKEKYAAALKLGEELKVKGGDVKEEGGKLIIKGTAEYGFDRDQIWNAIKKQSGWESEIVADIKVEKATPYGYWVVKSGETLSKIAKNIYERRERVHEDLRGEQGPAEGPQHDQGGAEARPAPTSRPSLRRTRGTAAAARAVPLRFPAAPASDRLAAMTSANGHRELWLVRHGETPASKGRTLAGWADVPLTAHGEEQASALRPAAGRGAVRRRVVLGPAPGGLHGAPRLGRAPPGRAPARDELRRARGAALGDARPGAPGGPGPLRGLRRAGGRDLRRPALAGPLLRGRARPRAPRSSSPTAGSCACCPGRSARTTSCRPGRCWSWTGTLGGSSRAGTARARPAGAFRDGRARRRGDEATELPGLRDGGGAAALVGPGHGSGGGAGRARSPSPRSSSTRPRSRTCRSGWRRAS